MTKVWDNEKFFKNFCRALKISAKTEANLFSILKQLDKSDQQKLTKYEASLKVINYQISPIVRFLNMDANAYSCKGRKNFIARSHLFEEILEKRSKNHRIPAIIKSLREISFWPMDLYLGSDISGDDFIFAFWLIFGGVKRGSAPVFWPYDFKKIMNIFFQNLKLKPPKFLRNKILNFGLDIEKQEVKYKIYYLCSVKENIKTGFDKISLELDHQLEGFKYFYFFSEMYNKQGRLTKKKLFLEFLEDIQIDDEKLMSVLLGKFSLIKEIKINPEQLGEVLKKIGGRISLISFEKNGTATFYLRPL